MATRRTIKTWEENHERLLSFYELDLRHPDIGHPKFGADVRFPELVDAYDNTFHNTLAGNGLYTLTSRESKTLPTLLNWACYFNYTLWGIEALRTISGQNQGAAVDFTRLLLHYAEDQFFKDLVSPLRDYLEGKWQIYFYCVPAISTETHAMTGQLFQSVGPLILCLLPKFPEVGRNLGVTEPKTIQLAGQVLWLVRSRLCAKQKIDGEKKQELIEVIRAWSKYVPPFTLALELDRMQKNNPYLITREIRQALLPETALNMLSLLEQTYEG